MCIFASNNNNNNNNKMNSLTPISSENPSPVAQQNERIRHSRGHVQLGILVVMYNAKSRMDGDANKLRRIGNISKIGFQMMAK